MSLTSHILDSIPSGFITELYNGKYYQASINYLKMFTSFSSVKLQTGILSDEEISLQVPGIR